MGIHDVEREVKPLPEPMSCPQALRPNDVPTSTTRDDGPSTTRDDDRTAHTTTATTHASFVDSSFVFIDKVAKVFAEADARHGRLLGDPFNHPYPGLIGHSDRPIDPGPDRYLRAYLPTKRAGTILIDDDCGACGAFGE